MTYQPVIPLSGYAGWQFVTRTYERQLESYSSSAQVEREISYFRDNIADATKVEDLVTNRRLLSVALGAYGLGDDIDKPAFVRKILEEGTLDPDSFANRLNNREYLEMARIFSYGNGVFKPDSVQIEKVIEQYRVRSFEEAVGETDNDMRLGLNFQREIADIANDEDLSERAGWFRVLGSLPLRQVIEGVFNMPSEFSQIDLDQQVEQLADKAELVFGGRTVAVFADPENVETAIRRFQLRQQINAGPSATTPGYGALQLLQSANGLGSAGSLNLFLSNTV